MYLYAKNTLRKIKSKIKVGVILLVLAMTAAASKGQTAPVPTPPPSVPQTETIRENEIKRAQEREREIREGQPKAPEIGFRGKRKKEKEEIPVNEARCFRIGKIELRGEDAGKFGFALREALGSTKILKREGGRPCLGAVGINRLMTLMQNEVIDKGFVTTRILAQPQDLKSGELYLTVMPGKIRRVRLDERDWEKRNLWRATVFNAAPMRAGSILNLRDIEQALENFKRVPTVEADIKIVPSKKANESDLVIEWRQKRIPVRVNVGVDDMGGRSTGKYQITSTVSWDNPLYINDLFYVSIGRDLQGYDEVKTYNAEGDVKGKAHGGVNNWSVYYSVPLGRWQLTLDASSYGYRQPVSGANQTYEYRGRSSSQNITITRMIYRDNKRKLTGYVKGWTRRANNYIDDTEIEVQRRKTAGYELGANYKEFFGQKTLESGVAYKRGTGALGALAAPEEQFGEGTSRMKILTGDVALGIPFVFKKREFTYSLMMHGQINGTALTPLDKLSIGDRQTVRGFSGENRLLADRGFFVRNETGMKVWKSHQVYAGLDGGNLSGKSTRYLSGKTLIGAALGIRGQMNLLKRMTYDVFAGVPIAKPKGFKTAKIAYGFNIGYSF